MKTQSTLRALLLGANFLLAPCVQAATYYWDTDGATAGSGGVTPSGTWSTGGTTWTTDSTGTTATSALTTTAFDDLFFSAGTDATGAYTVSLNSTTQNARLVTFEDGTATLTAATGTLSLGTGGGITVTTNTVTGSTISCDLTLSGSQTFNVAAGRTLTLDTGTFTRNAGATLNVLSTGTVTSTMTNLTANDATGIIGNWASYNSGTSTTYAKFTGSTITGLGYTGGADGSVAAASTNVVTGGGNLNYTLNANGTLGASASINTLRYTLAAGGTLTTSTSFTTNGIMNTGGGTLTFSGSVTSGTGEMVLHAANGTIRLAGLVNSGNLVTVTGSGTVTFNAGTYSGLGGLTMNGSGLLDFQPAGAGITYSGTTTLNAGTFQINNNAPSGNIILNGGSIKLYFGSSMTRNLGSGVGQIQIIGGASGFDGNNGACTVNFFNNGSEVQWGSPFFNPTSLRFQDTAGGSGVNDRITFVNALDLNGATRTIANNSATGGPVTFSGVIRNMGGGTAGLIKTGVGTLTLTNAGNSYNGDTTISQGTLNATSSGALGSATNTLVFNGGTFQAGASFTSVSTRSVTMTATGIIDSNAFALGIAGNIGGAGGLTKNSTGTLTLSGTNTYGGVTTVNAGTLVITKEASLASNTAANLNVKSGATLQLNVDSAGTAGFSGANLGTLLGNISVAGSSTAGLQAGANLVIDTSTATAGTFTQTSAITNSTGAFGGVITLTKIGAGTLIFDQANTYTGVTTITTGTLQLNAGGVIATAIGNNAAFVINSAGAVNQGTHFGLISGTGSLTQSGAGTLTLNLANTHSGLTTVSAGTLALTNAFALEKSALVTTSGISTYSGGAALTIGGLSGATGDLGSANVLNGYTGIVTALTLNPQTGVTVTYGGVISDGSGAMSLTKTGAGTQILTGANTYTGATIINQGTLTIGAGGSISSSSALQINGGTLSYGNTTTGLTLNGFTVGAGNASLSNTAAGQTLTLGAITRTPSLFGTVNFTTLTGAISTTTGITNGIIGAWATTGSTTTLRYAVGSPDGIAPTNISAFTTGTAATANTLANVTDATVNYEYSAAVAAMGAGSSLTGNTLRYSGGATSTAIEATSTLTLNGLMQAGTGLLTISGGPTTGGILIGSTGELVITANAQATTISAAIGGTGRLVYSGAGSTLTLSSTTSAYDGGTVVNSGTLTITANTNLGNASGGITLNGGNLRMPGVNIASARIVTVNGTGSTMFVNKNNNFATTGKLTGDGTLATLDGGGAGTLSIYSFNSTSNDYTGRLTGTNTTINVNSFANSTNSIVLDGATFNYGTGAAAASNLSTRAIELSGTTGGATITNSNTTAANTLSIGGGLVFTGIGNKTLTLGGVNTGNNSFSGNITDGPGSVISLTKSGTGTWVIGGNNTFTGATNISAAGGRLSLNNLNAIANSSSVTVASGGTLGFAIAGTYATAGTINIAGVGATLPGGAGALWFGQGGSYASTLNATINMTAAATIGSFGNVMTQILGGAITGTGALTIQSQGGTTTDTATWNLNAASTYSGNTIFTTSGGVRDMTVKLGVHNALPTTTSLNLQSSNSQAVNTFTTFDLNGFNQTLTGLTDTGGTPPAANNVGKRVINSSGTLSTLTINNAGAVTYGTSGTRILAGTIGGLDASGAAANNLALTKTGAGVLTLASNASSFTGNILISNGTLTASVGGLGANPTTSALGNTQTVGRTITVSSGAILNFSASDVMGNGGTTVVAKLIANGGTIRNTGAVFNMLGAVDLNGGTLSSNGGSSAAFPSFALGGTVTVGGSAVSTISSTGANSQIGLQNAGTTFNVGDAVVGSGSDLNVTGVLAAFNSGTGALIKSGAGTMTLSATNTYTGATNVNAGTLLVNGSISSSSLTTVASTATIGGSGTVGALTVSSGGFISGGDSAGDYTSTLNINGAYSQAGQYTAHIDGITAGNFDQLNVTGAVNITGGSLVAAFSGSYLVNDLIFILLNDGGDAITGTYGFAQGATVVTYGGFDWSISYEANSAGSSFTGGNDIALQAVLIPEPKTALLGCLGVLLLLRRRR